MKHQRYVTNNGVMPPGTWVKASDAERLETAVERATANMVHAQNRAAELEKENSELKELRERMDAYLDAQKPKKEAKG
jgi:hypothetical protein